MSGGAPLSPNTVDTVNVPDGKGTGAILPSDMRAMEDSLSGLFAQSGFTTSQTLTAVEHGTLLPFTASAALTLTIPPNSTVPLPIGVMYTVLLLAASTNTLQILGNGVSGVVVNSNSSSPGTPFLRGASSFAFLYQLAANVWYVGGDLS